MKDDGRYIEAQLTRIANALEHLASLAQSKRDWLDENVRKKEADAEAKRQAEKLKTHALFKDGSEELQP